MGISATEAHVGGIVSGPFVNQWLAPYYIELGGRFTVEAVSRNAGRPDCRSWAGAFLWTGGPIRYRLSGNMHDSVLPPMTADLGPAPEAVAYATGESTPLLHAALEIRRIRALRCDQIPDESAGAALARR